MAIRKFELYHGAVLVKIVRRSRSLTLFERGSDTAWAAYLVNDKVCLYVTSSDQRGVSNGDARFSYTFQPQETKFLRDQLALRGEGGVFLALVCEDQEVALLDSAQARRCIDLESSKAQNLTVLIPAGKSLRVYGPLNGRSAMLTVSRNRIDNQDFPS